MRTCSSRIGHNAFVAQANVYCSRPVRVLPRSKGTRKTSLPEELCLERGTDFERADFLDAVEIEDCGILLDEANRTHPENLNSPLRLPVGSASETSRLWSTCQYTCVCFGFGRSGAA